MRPFVCRVRTAAATVTVAALTVASCRDPRRAPLPPPASAAAVTVASDDPLAVARDFLRACADIRDLGRVGMRDEAARAAFSAAQATVMALADREGVAAVGKNQWGRATVGHAREHRIDSIVKNWPAIVAHYAAGLALDAAERLEPMQVGPAGNVPALAGCVVAVPAVNPQHQTRVAAIRARAAATTDLRGKPLVPGSEAFETFVRREATRQGLSPNPDATVYISLRQVAAGWRVIAVGVGPRRAATPVASAPGQTAGLAVPGAESAGG